MQLYRAFTLGFALVISGLTLCASGIGYALLVELNRYSAAVEVMGFGLAVFLGFALIMLGLGVFSRQKPFYLLTSAVAYALSIFVFIYIYPSQWFYPAITYIALLYAFSTCLLLYRILIQAGSYMLNTQKQVKTPDNRVSPSAALAHFALIAGGSGESLPASQNSPPGSEKTCESATDSGYAEPDKHPATITISGNAGTEADNKKTSGETPELSSGLIPAVISPNKEEAVTADINTLDMPVCVDDSMAGASRKVFNYHFQKMQIYEHGTKVGRDIEQLHDMRVSAMRIKAAFDVFAPYLKMNKMAPQLKNVRKTRRKLGDVRDIDVFIQKVESYCNQLPEEQCADLQDMMDSMEIERTKKRGEMLVYLDDGNYGSFKKQFKKALLNDRLWEMNTAGNDGKPLPYKVKDVLPILVYGQFSSLLSYDELVSKNPDEIPMELLHQLRIDVKIMRYNLEFFRDVLGKESKILIQVLKDLQDNLGDMHDASVAIELLQGYEETGRWGVKEADAGKLDGAIAANKTIEALVISRHEEIAELKAAFPEKWGAIRDPEFGAGLASSIAGLYRQN